MKLENKKTVTILIILICVLQGFMALFWTEQKKYLFMDEMFSYASANNAEKVGTMFPENEWLDETWYLNYMSVQEEHRFDYSIPYHNQDMDVHPPLFYMFLHTACSFTPGSISYTTGIFWNIVFYCSCTIILYFLCKDIFNSKTCGLLIALLYAISFAGMNTVVFIRMYMLMTFLTLLHVYAYVRYFREENIPIQGYIFLGLSLIAGVLTQYYFVFIALFASVWFGIKFIVNKQYIKLGKYIGTLSISAIISIILYPTMLKHLFGTGRSEEAMGNLTSTEGYFLKVKTMWKLMDSQLFTNMFLVILIGIVGVLVFCIVKKKNIEFKEFSSVGMIFFICIGYFLIVTKVAPYQIDRYLMPIYPLVYMCVVGIAYKLLNTIIYKKYAILLCVIGFTGLSIIHMIYSGIPYTYARDEIIVNRISVADEYQQSYALYIGPKDDMSSYYDVLQVLKEYKGYYNVNDLSSISKVKEDMTELDQDEDIVLYIEHQDDMEEVFDFVKDVFDIPEFGEENLINQDQKWDVYFLER